MSLQYCLTVCNPIEGSLPGYLIPGILQARVVEWVAIAFSDFAYIGREKSKTDPLFLVKITRLFRQKGICIPISMVRE